MRVQIRKHTSFFGIALFLFMVTLLAQPLDVTDALAERMGLVEADPTTELAAGVLPAHGDAYETAARTASVTDDDILWLARCIYSETKRPEEQELVAWVVRNRVDSRYRGSATYRDVVLDPYQFSAFNPGSRKRAHYSGLSLEDTPRGWQEALRIARRVATASETVRPFDATTRHFYSERSMPGGKMPTWAQRHQPVALDRPIDPKRFRFYNTVN